MRDPSRGHRRTPSQAAATPPSPLPAPHHRNGHPRAQWRAVLLVPMHHQGRPRAQVGVPPRVGSADVPQVALPPPPSSDAAPARLQFPMGTGTWARTSWSRPARPSAPAKFCSTAWTRTAPTAATISVSHGPWVLLRDARPCHGPCCFPGAPLTPPSFLPQN